MNVSDAIKTRKSVRVSINKPVEQEKIFKSLGSSPAVTVGR